MREKISPESPFRQSLRYILLEIECIMSASTLLHILLTLNINNFLGSLSVTSLKVLDSK